MTTTEYPGMREKLRGSPRRGLTMATLGFGAGLTSIVFYGVAGPTFKESLGLSGAMLGLLLSSPHVSKAVLRVPFGAWVDEVGGRKPFLILLGLMIAGMAGVVGALYLYYPTDFDSSLLPFLIAAGVLAGAGGATFSVGIPQTAFWYPADRQGFSLGVYAGAGNIAPGIMNLMVPLMIAAWGLAAAYLSWLLLVIGVTIAYAWWAVDAYYFQLRQHGFGDEEARERAASLGQSVFPSGSTWLSMKLSAQNYRTWILVFLYTISFGGGFTALTAWFPAYWNLFHGASLAMAGLLAGAFTVYGSLIRIPGGSLSDRLGGENVAMASFAVMALGALLLTVSTAFAVNVVGMFVLATGMGVANAAIFELVPKYVPDAVGGASGWIGGVGGAGTLIILPVLGAFADTLGMIGYARGFVVFVIFSTVCVAVIMGLKRTSRRERNGSVQSETT